VDDAGRVRGFERVGDLDRQRQQSIDLERTPVDLMLQRRPVEKLHDKKRAGRLGNVAFENSDQISSSPTTAAMPVSDATSTPLSPLPPDATARQIAA